MYSLTERRICCLVLLAETFAKSRPGLPRPAFYRYIINNGPNQTGRPLFQILLDALGNAVDILHSRNGGNLGFIVGGVGNAP